MLHCVNITTTLLGGTIVIATDPRLNLIELVNGEFVERDEDKYIVDSYSGKYIRKSKAPFGTFRGQIRYDSDRLIKLPNGELYPSTTRAYDLGRNGLPYHLDTDNARRMQGERHIYGINCYSTKAEQMFGFIGKDGFYTREPKKGVRYYGVEIELECSRIISADTMLRLEPELIDIGFIATSDGSLNSGIEFKSAPMVWSELEKNLAKFYEIIAPLELVAKDTCGFHVHVSRSSVTELQIARVMSLVYGSVNSKTTQILARRASNTYQEYLSMQGFTLRSKKGHLKLRGESKLNRGRNGETVISGEGRYTAINVAGSRTVEFRLFAGAETLTDAMHSLDVVRALLAYTAPGSVNISQTKIGVANNFVNWLLEPKNRKEYKLIAKEFNKEKRECA